MTYDGDPNVKPHTGSLLVTLAFIAVAMIVILIAAACAGDVDEGNYTIVQPTAVPESESALYDLDLFDSTVFKKEGHSNKFHRHIDWELGIVCYEHADDGDLSCVKFR